VAVAALLRESDLIALVPAQLAADRGKDISTFLRASSHPMPINSAANFHWYMHKTVRKRPRLQSGCRASVRTSCDPLDK